VWAGCVFVDPIADVAALGSPDNQELGKEAEAYDALVEPAIPLPIGELPFARSPIALSTGDTILGRRSAECQAWLLSLDLRWFRCTIKGFNTALWIEGAAEDIAGGCPARQSSPMTGRPLGLFVRPLAVREAAIGKVVLIRFCRVNCHAGLRKR
jgi:hypothetical protein